MPAVTVQEIFKAANLAPCGPIRWKTPLPERRCGIYIIECAGEIVYIGRTKRPLRKRLREFYRHRCGESRPHSGGQEVLKLTRPLRVYWAATDDYAGAEDKMIEKFRARIGRLPYANRVRSARVFLKPRYVANA